MEPIPKAEFSIVTRTSAKAWLPGLIAAAGPEVTETYIDFFTSTIRNRNTRQAYARACWQFFDWCAAHGQELTTVRPFHVAAWIEDFPGSKPTIKQKLAAVRMLYDFLVVRQITRSNPAHSVRGPKYVVKKGKTPVWSREDAKTLLDSIPKDSVSGLRDLWMSHLASNRHHHLPGERRTTRTRPADGGTRVPANYQTLRSDKGRDYTERGGAHPGVCR